VSTKLHLTNIPYHINQSKFYSGRNQELIEVRECLLLFGAESFVFQFAIKHIKIKIYRTIILLVVLYGCFRIGCWGEYFGPRRDEVTGEWRKLHNVELNDLYCSYNIVRVI
jgi:hypothetical protein